MGSPLEAALEDYERNNSEPLTIDQAATHVDENEETVSTGVPESDRDTKKSRNKTIPALLLTIGLLAVGYWLFISDNQPETIIHQNIHSEEDISEILIEGDTQYSSRGVLPKPHEILFEDHEVPNATRNQSSDDLSLISASSRNQQVDPDQASVTLSVPNQDYVTPYGNHHDIDISSVTTIVDERLGIEVTQLENRLSLIEKEIALLKSTPQTHAVTPSTPQICILTISHPAGSCSGCKSAAWVKYKGQKISIVDGSTFEKKYTVQISSNVVKLTDPNSRTYSFTETNKNPNC